MKIKVLGAALTAALLGLSTASFGQSTDYKNSAGARGATSGQDNPGANETSGAGRSAGTGSSTDASGSAARSSKDSAACDSLTGMEKTRCLRNQDNASTGSAGVVPQRPGQSGDKADPMHPNVPGTGAEKARSQ